MDLPLTSTSPKPTIILAGGTGQLGFLIAKNLLHRGAKVKALIRAESGSQKVAELKRMGAEVILVDFHDPLNLSQACAGGSCVVSALSGLREVIVGVQTRLLEAAINAGVPRFIPSDFAIDFTKLPEGSNRNLDLRREFGITLDQAPLAATSILNGMFTDLLIGPAPVVLFKINRIMYWGNRDQFLDFTTMADTAAFTAAAALDPETPRYLKIAGDTLSVRGLKGAASAATGQPFRLMRLGPLWLFKAMIRLTKTLSPKTEEVFPAWQGMQYLYNMFTGKPKLTPLDNDRYPEIKWTKVEEVLKQR